MKIIQKKIVKPINDKIINNFPYYSFLLSDQRYRYNGEINNTSRRVFILKENGPILALLSYQIIKSRFGYHLKCLHTPAFSKHFFNLEANRQNQVIKYINNLIEKVATKNKCFLARLEYMIPKESKYKPLIKFIQTKSKDAPIQAVDATITQQINISQSQDILLSNMRSSTRLNIKKLLKQTDISVEISQDAKFLDYFFKFHNQTRLLKHYKEKPESVIRQEIGCYLDKMVYFPVAFYRGEPIGVWICVQFGKYFANYLAALDVNMRKQNMRASYLLFWESLLKAKNLGCEIFDLWGGMKPDDYNKRTKWDGINSFKRGFGGNTLHYMHIQDIPITPKYFIYNIYSKHRTRKMGYYLDW